MTFFSAHYFYSGFYTPAYFDDYFKALQSKSLEEITEHSHRMPLENLLNAIAHHGHKLQVLHEPKRTQGFGAPDFKTFATGSIVGHIENKKLGEVLSKLLSTTQIKCKALTIPHSFELIKNWLI